MTISRVSLAGLLIVVACYSKGASRPTPRQRDVISRQEILEAPLVDQDLFSAIRSLRPQFLSAPPGVSRATAAPLAVYINGLRQNGVVALGSVRASAVEEVRYLDPTTALNTYGSMASGGAIVVRMYDPSKARPPGDDASR